jgi:hypothetical protein
MEIFLRMEDSQREKEALWINLNLTCFSAFQNIYWFGNFRLIHPKNGISLVTGAAIGNLDNLLPRNLTDCSATTSG